MIKFKRFAAAVISVVMLASMLPQALAADAVEYYFADGSKAASSQGYSGEALKEIYAASTVVPTITHSFELAKSGTYDIWISSLEGVYKPYTGFKMNDETEYTAITSDKAANDGGSNVGIEMAWHKVGIKSLSAGANTLDISAIFIQGESRYVSAVRSVAIVPRSYNWDPTKTATPEQCETPAGADYFYKNATEADYNDGYTVREDDQNENRMQLIADRATAPKLYFDVYLNNSGVYDIWLDSTASWWTALTGYKMNDDASFIPNNGAQIGENTGSQDAVPTGWFKVDTRMLNSGYNGFTVGAAAKDGNRWLSAVKRVAIVPRSYNWDPTKTATPEQCETPAGADYFYKNATEADYNDGYTVREDDQNENRMQLIADRATAPKLYFDVYLNNGGVYDIWLDSTASWWTALTGYKMNDDASFIPNNGAQIGENTGSQDAVPTGWFKVDTRMLNSGYNGFTVGAVAKNGNRWLSAVKRVAIVPKSYNWDPTKSEIPEQCEADPATEYGFSYAKDYAVKTGNWAQSPVRNTTMVCMWTQEENNTLIYEVNLANDGNYDFWIENVSNDWAGKLTYSIDGGEYTAASGNFVGEAVESYNYGIKTQWQKAKTVNLTAGVHTVTFKLNRYNDNGYIGAMNAFALSPKSWKWSPVDSPVPVEPVKPEAKEYAWLEAENFDVPDGSRFVSEINDAASGKTYMKVDHTVTDAETNDITYTFEVSKKSTFDIDILSTLQGVSYQSQAKFKIDDGEFAYMKDNAVGLSDSIYSIGGIGTSWSSVPMQWYRIARQSLTAGEHTITIRVDESRADGGPWFFAFDAVAVVPQMWNYTPKGNYEEPKIGDYAYISANNGYTKKNGYTESNRVMQVLADGSTDYPMPEKAPQLDFAFRLANTNTYDIWVDSITGANYDTLIEYSIDDYTYKNYTQSTAAKYGKNTASGIGIGQYSTAWHKIATTELTGTVHTMSLRAILDPKTNRYLSAVGRIVVVPTSWNWLPESDGSPYDVSNLPLSVSQNPNTEAIVLERGKDLETSFISNLTAASDADVIYEIKLEWNGEKVNSILQRPNPLLKNREANKDYTESFKINVPSYAPDGNYKLKVRTGGNAKWITVAEATLGSSEVIKKTAAVSALNISGTTATASISANAEATAKARLEFYKDGVLWAVSDFDEINVSENTGDYTFNFAAPKIPAGQYTVKMGVQGFETQSAAALFTVENGADAKPLSNGNYYSKKTGNTHFWYVNQSGAMIWDGKPFVPMGGMFCSEFIESYNSDSPVSNKYLLKNDLNVLEELERRGIKDLYINAKLTEENLAAWDYFTQYLDEHGFRYGIQPSAATSNSYDGYYIGANVNAIKATAAAGASEASVNVKLTQLGYPEEINAKFYVISNGSCVQRGDALYTKNDSTVTFKAEGLNAADAEKTVCFLPYVKGAQITVPNIFEKEKAATFEKLNELFTVVSFGDGFRLVVDPTYNEIAFSNPAECFVPYNEEYVAGYAAWLENKYKTIAALNSAWEITPEVTSFADAARMMPINTNNGTTILAKADTNEIYSYNSASGCMWDDCVLYREYALAAYLTDTADVIKTNSDIPVVYKNVQYINPFFVNSNVKGGHDGIGAEAYGSFETVAAQTAVAGALCRQSAKTMWNLVTETNTTSDVVAKKESGIVSYGDKKTMYEHFNSLYSAGAKGVYDFVFNNRNEYVKAYAYTEKPEMYRWLGEYAAALNPAQITKGSANEQIYAIYPAPTATWNWNGTSIAHNKRTAVIPENDSDLYSNTVLSNGAYVMGTNNLDISADTIIINIKNAPLSKVYGKEIDEKLGTLAAKKNVMVMGLRYDLGQIPAIDQYYTNEFSTLGGDKVQILNPPAGAMTLATADNGKVCAFKYGNLYVIANDNWKNHEEYLTGNALASANAALNKAYYTKNETVYAKPQTGANSVTFKFNNYTAESVSGSIIIAINGCEELIDVPVTISAKTKNAEITKTINVNSENIGSVNYYFWNSLGEMTPIVPKQ